MRFEPADYERVFSAWLDPAGREYAALERRLVLGEEHCEIGRAFGITEKAAAEYCRLAWQQVFPPVTNNHGERERERRLRIVIEAATWEIDPNRAPVEYVIEVFRFRLFILKECGVLKYWAGSWPQARRA